MAEEKQKVVEVVEEIQSVNSTLQSQEVTDFVDESSEVMEVVKGDVMSIERPPYPVETICTFLQRPYIVWEGVWGSNSVRGACLARIPFPEALFAKAALWSKLANFQYLRAGVHVAVRLNGTPFHYGKLLGVWRPLCLNNTTNVTSSTATTVTPGSYDNLFTLSGNPHVLISPNTNRTFEMSMDYNLPVDWISMLFYSTKYPYNTSLTRTTSALGSFELWVLNPLMCGNTAATPNVGVTIYANFTNVELGGYTSSAFVLSQMYLPMFTSVVWPSGWTFDPVTPKAQGLAEVVENVKQALPFSRSNKPSEEETLKVVQYPPNLASSDVLTPGMQISLSRYNKFNGGTFLKSDCMSWSSQVSIPSLLGVWTIPSTQAVGSVIAQIPVCPTWFSTVSVGNKTAWLPTRMGALVVPFQLWRGTLTYHFSLVCSSFHSFRLGIAWKPDALKESTISDLYSMVNKTVDIQGETTFDVSVPMHASRSFLRLGFGSTRSNGCLLVTLINPISYPEKQIPNVYMNVWVSSSNLQVAKLEGPSGLDETFRSIKLSLAAITTAQAKDEDPRSNVDKSHLMSYVEPVSKVLEMQGEEIKTLLDITSKPSYISTLHVEKELRYTPFCPLNTDTAREVFAITSLAQWYGMLHAAHVGPVGFTVPNVPSGSVVAWAVATGYLFTHYEATSTQKSADAILESQSSQNLVFFPTFDNAQKQFILPWYSNLYFKPFNLKDWQDNDSNCGLHSLRARIIGANSALLFEFTSEGFKYLYPVGCPVLVPNSTVLKSEDARVVAAPLSPHSKV